MNIRAIYCSILTIGLLAGTLTGCVSERQQQARLEAKAKVTKADAEKTALAKVPGGKVTSGELEEENGKLLWSFDIFTPNSKDITEVQVDALTGAVLSIVKETAKAEAKEKKKKKD